MGIVFGKSGVAEPAFDLILTRNTAKIPYEIRKYGQRFAIETHDDPGAFGRLAGYIGVTSAPQNDGNTKIAMTAPVVTEEPKKDTNLRGEKIAMTAPVVTEKTKEGGEEGEDEVMQFILPAEYDSLEKIPKPTNPNVHIKPIAPSVGAVYKTNGKVDPSKGDELAVTLVTQLHEDGLVKEEEKAVEEHQLWRYDPPFTIPYFRRNEVWVELDGDLVESYLKRHSDGEESAS